MDMRLTQMGNTKNCFLLLICLTLSSPIILAAQFDGSLAQSNALSQSNQNNITSKQVKRICKYVLSGMGMQLFRYLNIENINIDSKSEYNRILCYNQDGDYDSILHTAIYEGRYHVAHYFLHYIKNRAITANKPTLLKQIVNSPTKKTLSLLEWTIDLKQQFNGQSSVYWLYDRFVMLLINYDTLRITKNSRISFKLNVNKPIDLENGEHDEFGCQLCYKNSNDD